MQQAKPIRIFLILVGTKAKQYLAPSSGTNQPNHHFSGATNRRYFLGATSSSMAPIALMPDFWVRVAMIVPFLVLEAGPTAVKVAVANSNTLFTLPSST